MKTLISRLESLRKKQGLKKSDMARLMGSNSLQQYNNWVYREALPDEWHDRAIEILRESGENVVLDAEILRKIQLLPVEKQQVVLSVIDGMIGPEAD